MFPRRPGLTIDGACSRLKCCGALEILDGRKIYEKKIEYFFLPWPMIDFYPIIR